MFVLLALLFLAMTRAFLISLSDSPLLVHKHTIFELVLLFFKFINSEGFFFRFQVYIHTYMIVSSANTES